MLLLLLLGSAVMFSVHAKTGGKQKEISNVWMKDEPVILPIEVLRAAACRVSTIGPYAVSSF